jgi:hypothetical protein
VTHMHTRADHEAHTATPAGQDPAGHETGVALDSGMDTGSTTGFRREAWQARHRAQENARRRLAQRYGSDLEKRWTADPNAPQVDAVSLLYAFLIKTGPANLRTPERDQAPALQRDYALAAARMIRVARRDAREREAAVMRHILAHGVTWDELAYILYTTPDELTQLLRQQGEQPDTWTTSAGGDR